MLIYLQFHEFAHPWFKTRIVFWNDERTFMKENCIISRNLESLYMLVSRNISLLYHLVPSCFYFDDGIAIPISILFASSVLIVFILFHSFLLLAIKLRWRMLIFWFLHPNGLVLPVNVRWNSCFNFMFKALNQLVLNRFGYAYQWIEL